MVEQRLRPTVEQALAKPCTVAACFHGLVGHANS
jgi:hypothetical protein